MWLDTVIEVNSNRMPTRLLGVTAWCYVRVVFKDFSAHVDDYLVFEWF